MVGSSKKDCASASVFIMQSHHQLGTYREIFYPHDRIVQINDIYYQTTGKQCYTIQNGKSVLANYVE